MSLPVFAPYHLLQPRSCPGADVTLGSGDGKADGAGNLFEVLSFKLIGEVVPEGLEEDGVLGLADGGSRRCSLW